MNDTSSKWKDKEWKRKYNKEYRERKKLELSSGQAAESGQELSVWKQRALKRRSSEVRPLFLDKCPSCEGEFLRRVNGRIEKMKLSSCSTCDLRFYQAGGKIE